MVMSSWFETRKLTKNLLTGSSRARMNASTSVMDAKERPDENVTGLLQAGRGGDIEARARLTVVVYRELRRRAAAYLRRERAGHTLQPTALVHEVFLLLVKQDRTAWQNRAQFFGVASQMMRRLLVDPSTGPRHGEAVGPVGPGHAR